MTSCISIPYSTIPSRGFSPAADFVARQVDELREPLQESIVFGWQKDVLMELYSVTAESQTPNWDGYGARPISWDAYIGACQFIEALPYSAPKPSVGAEPDGHITLEWHSSPRRTLSVSISPDGEIHYAALIGMSKKFGTEIFYGAAPREILDLIGRVTG